MPKTTTPTATEIRKMILQDAIRIYTECIDDLTADIEFHTEEYSDTYYGMMESVTSLKTKRDITIQRLEALK